MTISFILGTIVGFVTFAVVCVRRRVGVLRIDTSDPDDEPYLFLELNNNINPHILRRYKFVVLDINPESYISQK